MKTRPTVGEYLAAGVAARQYGVTESTILKVLKGESWKGVGYCP